MAIVGIGTDLVAIRRFRALKHPERVASFFLSEGEQREATASRDHAQALASRFALKEAIIKSAPETLSPLSFEIYKEGPKPSVRFSEPKAYSFLLSLSHEEDLTCAVALCQA